MQKVWKRTSTLVLAATALLTLAIASGCPPAPQRAPGERGGPGGVDIGPDGAGGAGLANRAADPDVVAGIERIAAGGPVTPGSPGTVGGAGAGRAMNGAAASAIVVGNAAIVGIRDAAGPAGTAPAAPGATPTSPMGAGPGGTPGTTAPGAGPGGTAGGTVGGGAGTAPGTVAGGVAGGVQPGSTNTVTAGADAGGLAQRISAAYPFIREVHVTRDPAVVSRIAAIAGDLRAGRPAVTHVDEIVRLIRAIPATPVGAAAPGAGVAPGAGGAPPPGAGTAPGGR